MWRDSYLVGNELIDTQHKELFDMSVGLLANLKEISAKADFKASLAETVQFLKGYVVKHFADEEEYMQSKGYKAFPMHKNFHTELTNDVLYYETELIKSDFALPVVQKFLGFVNVWLIQHVAGEDQKFSDSYIQKEVANDISSKTTDVITMMSGYDMSNATASPDNIIPADSGLCYKVGLTGGSGKTVGFAYSNNFSFGMYKAMTGLDYTEPDDLIISVMSEISNIIAGRLAPIASDNDPAVDIEIPVQVVSSAFPAQREITYLKTSIGDMAVLVF